jgi:outer membrane receptor for ferrienterochelin and colicins
MLKPFPLAPLSLFIANAFSFSAMAAEPAPIPNGEASPAVPATSPALPKAAIKPVAPAVQKAEVTGTNGTETDERRRSTASRIIYGREELDRNGDSNIGDILKRLPGVTIGGRPGRGGDIRMRGMGGGYTQILLNGERPPAGFSMESIPPDQVERIEIIRGTVAEFSTQAIAGTINIVLREEYKQKGIDLKLSQTVESNRSTSNLAITYPGQIGDISYSINGSANLNNRNDSGTTNVYQTDDAGNFQLQQNTISSSSQKTKSLNIAPRISYKAANGDTFTLQQFIATNQSDTRNRSHLDQQTAAGFPAPEYADAFSTGDNTNTFGRFFGNYQHRFANKTKLNLKFGGGFGRSDSNSIKDQYDASGTRLISFSDVSKSDSTSLNLGGKYSMPLFERHALGLGLETELNNRDQTSTSLARDQSNVWKPRFAESGDNLTAKTRRFAAFAQDEFDITDRWSAYAGLRWEGIRTISERKSGNLENSSSVWSPILQTVWKIPGTEKDQLRGSITSAYRAPQTNDLIALPALSQPNDQNRPDRIGNPNLKPELSKGIDAAYEHYIGRDSIISANFFVRSIDDLIRRRLTREDNGSGLRWTSRPENIGKALTKGIELEAKFQVREFIKDAPAIDFRTNYSRFWSSVDDVKGPNNRLEQQPKETANIGVDYRPKAIPLTFGASVNLTPGYTVQVSNDQLSNIGLKRQVDWYALWKINPTTQLRISAANLLADDAVGSGFDTSGDVQRTTNTLNKTYTAWTARLELKL